MQDDQFKTWKTFGVFDTYEEASEKKIAILHKFDLVKIKRSGRGGNQFKIKTWNPQLIKQNKKKSKKKANRWKI